MLNLNRLTFPLLYSYCAGCILDDLLNEPEQAAGSATLIDLPSSSATLNLQLSLNPNYPLAEYYLILTEELPHTKDLEKDKLGYRNIAISFLLTCSPNSLYYGKYINTLNEDKIVMFTAQESENNFNKHSDLLGQYQPS